MARSSARRQRRPELGGRSGGIIGSVARQRRPATTTYRPSSVRSVISPGWNIHYLVSSAPAQVRTGGRHSQPEGTLSMWTFSSRRLRRWVLFAIAWPMARLLVSRLARAADHRDPSTWTAKTRGRRAGLSCGASSRPATGSYPESRFTGPTRSSGNWFGWCPRTAEPRRSPQR